MTVLLGPPTPLRSMGFPPINIVWAHYMASAATGVFVGLGILYTARMLMRRRRWALATIEVCSVLMIGWTLLFAFNWVRMIFGTSGPTDVSPAVFGIRLAMAVTGGCVLGGIAAAFAYGFWIMRRPSFRSEFDRHHNRD